MNDKTRIRENQVQNLYGKLAPQTNKDRRRESCCSKRLYAAIRETSAYEEAHFRKLLGDQIMTETEYNRKVKAAAEAYLNKVISYDAWHAYMEQLIEEKENSSIGG